MKKDSITNRKTHREKNEKQNNETDVIVRLWKLTLKCQDVMKYNFANRELGRWCDTKSE